MSQIFVWNHIFELLLQIIDDLVVFSRLIIYFKVVGIGGATEFATMKNRNCIEKSEGTLSFVRAYLFEYEMYKHYAWKQDSLVSYPYD